MIASTATPQIGFVFLLDGLDLLGCLDATSAFVFMFGPQGEGTYFFVAIGHLRYFSADSGPAKTCKPTNGLSPFTKETSAWAGI